MGYGSNSIRIQRERDGYIVRVNDPEIEKANRARDSKNGSMSGEWHDPEVQFEFDDKAKALKFVDGAMDIALPADDYSTTFDKLAKQAKGKSDE